MAEGTKPPSVRLDADDIMAEPSQSGRDDGRTADDVLAEPLEEAVIDSEKPSEPNLEKALEAAQRGARIDAFRAKIRHGVKGVVGVLGAGALAGGISGHLVQGAYRDATGYGPDGYEDTNEETPRKGWFKRRWEKAKNALKEKAEPALAFGDTVAFWGPFWLAFLAFSAATNKLLAGYRRLFHPVPPEVEAYCESIIRRQLDMRAEMEKLHAQFTGENPHIPAPDDIQRSVAQVVRGTDEMQRDIDALEDGRRRKS